MFCKFLTAVILFVSVSACAKPNYQNQESTTGQNAQQTGQCNLLLKAQNICVDIKWEVQPSDTDAGVFNLHFYDPQAVTQLIDPAYSVAVVLWMPSMGHGSSPVKVEKLENGIYKASNVFFVMPGDWEIRIQLKDGKNVVEQVIQAINI